MRQMTLEQQQLYSAIGDASGKPDLALNLFRIGLMFDFACSTFLVMPSKTDQSISSLIIETNAPDDFYENLDQVAPPKDSYVYDAARCTVLPLSWSAEQVERQCKLINSAPPLFLKHYTDHGFSRGLVIPLSSLDGSRHIIRFDGDRRPMEQIEINDLTMLALHFFQSYDRNRYPLTDNPCGLTEREVEIVRWTAKGKTSAEIGMIMSLSDHTVNAYMNNAVKKLDCVNRTQLVAKAIRMRVIS
ncbi:MULTISPECIES: helix-turn-helix transcriptional regulator [unclassified Rhizobium]|uniref:helix-turn-helix transcriptional regulator n=1 Tax=unclassified Rhizobium TaxID=2613769 RepID=UPI0015FF61CA|nr:MULTISPECIES: LuxR C-terminal-related transcriptional regulator [unclassified Rhizobium]MBB1250395.1 autoinducer binding domain-containing protein [Rhizobium sp. G21]MCV3764884.1 LuxR C-terminal-related transcriptional regulator [Rhizobium sp. TRM95796]